jgi:Uncharacterized protein conserved in bacteria
MGMIVMILIILLMIGLIYWTWFKNETVSKKGKINRTIVFVAIGGVVIGVFFPKTNDQAMVHETSSTQTINEAESVEETTDTSAAMVDEMRLDVPLLNQMDEPRLYNGCEVTSLAMLLQYLDVEVSKNELADKVAKVPFEDDAGNHGDPHEGFVGDISGVNPGYSVYVEPMMELASQYVDADRVIDLSGDFMNVLQSLSEKQPVWCITTVTFAATDDLETWQTVNGPIKISWNVHSVLITGFDQEHIYLNDPYGEKRVVDRDDFIASWEQMGSQAFTIKKTS